MASRHIKNEIQERAERRFVQLVRLRRQIHRRPELGFEEHRTAQVVSRTLTSLGLRVKSGIAGTGVVGILRGRKARPVLALRADMDALPIQELNRVPYRSRVPGKMHACGHDAHTTIMLGAAMILSGLRDRLEGSVKFIFEPSEEKNPPGARELIRRGVLSSPRVDAIFGLHVFARAEAGRVGFRAGPMMAAADEISITIRGKSGHGALPHLTVDPVVVAAEVIVALQKIVSRNLNPFQPGVLTLGKISGGTARNIIPDEVVIAGTLRSMDERWRKDAHRLLRRTVKGVTAAAGASYSLEIVEGAPLLVNDPRLTAFARGVCEEYLGPARVFDVEPVMGGESFGYFLQRVPGTFFRLGIANRRKGIVHDIHTGRFDIDEKALTVGAGYVAYLAHEYLRSIPPGGATRASRVVS